MARRRQGPQAPGKGKAAQRFSVRERGGRAGKGFPGGILATGSLPQGFLLQPPCRETTEPWSELTGRTKRPSQNSWEGNLLAREEREPKE